MESHDYTSPQRLYFHSTETPQPLAELTVKADTTTTLLGRPATLMVIGESHYVSCPPLRYFELFSCTSLRTDGTVLSLHADTRRTVSFENSLIAAETQIASSELSAMPPPESCTLAYRFGPEAWTLIDATERGFETYHSYPEHDRLVRSETTVRSHDSL